MLLTTLQPAPDPGRMARWAASLRRGDGAAFEALFRALHPPLVRFAAGFVQSGAEAEDLVQEAFVRLWERRADIDPTLSVRAWLYRTVRNRALNQIRDRRRRADLLDAQPPRPTTTAAPDIALEARALADRLRTLVAALPERQREAFVLTRVEGLAHTEVAEVMGIAASTVNVHLVRALKALRAGLADR
ncbi:MAG: RNA polymerase sigma-70 factor [Bacteroidota bacterium]